MLLRPRQTKFIDRAAAALRERGNTLAIAPTGFGNRTPDEIHQFFDWLRAEEPEDPVQAMWDRSDVVEVAQ